MSSQNDKNYMIVYFPSDGKYTIARDGAISVKNVTDTSCECKFNGTWYEGEIKYRGTQKKCRSKSLKIETTGYIETDSDDVALTQPDKQQPSDGFRPNRGQKRQFACVTRSSSHIISSLTNEINRFKSIQTEQIHIETEMDHSAEPRGEPRDEPRGEPRYEPRYEPRGEPRDEPRVNFDGCAGLESLHELFDQMREMRDLVRNLQKNAKKDEPKWVEEIMYNGLNLLDIWASQQNKYVTALMEALFTAEEMDKGYIKEGINQSTRTNLDPERIQLLKLAFITKYQLSNEKKAWRFIRKVANKKCYDTSRKLKKAIKNQEAASQPIGHQNKN